MSKSKYNVVIIGAGAAGLAAAKFLKDWGMKDFVILEAQGRTGGRIHTRLIDGRHLEYGAQFVHGEDGNMVYTMGENLNLIDKEPTFIQTGLGNTIFIREDGTFVPEETASEFLQQMFFTDDEEDRQGCKGSLGHFRYNRFLKVCEYTSLNLEMLDWCGKFWAFMDGTFSIFDVAANSEKNYKECSGNQVVNLHGGYYHLIKFFKNELLHNQLRKNCPVKKISFNNKNKSCNHYLEIQLASGELIYANHVIYTPSLAVLKETVKDMFDFILPPTKMSAIQGLGIDVVDKIFLKFSENFWQELCSGFSFLKDSPIKNFHENNWEDGIIGFYEVYKHPTMLCGYITGDAARWMEKAPINEVKDRSMELLRRYLKHKEIPTPIWCDRSTWALNPWIRGSYSFRSVVSESMNVYADDLASPLFNNDGVPVVCFAGEATHRSYFSTVHGAVESGIKAAEIIFNYSREQFSLPRVMAVAEASYDVIIVGAGAAGLQAAKEFLNHGVKSILILEGSNRIGGRVHSLFTISGTIELGAQWIHGEKGNKLFEAAKPLDLIHDTVSVDGGGTFLLETGEKIPSHIVEEVLEVLDKISEMSYSSSNIKKEASVGHFFLNEFVEYLHGCIDDTEIVKELKMALFSWRMRWEKIDNACSSLYTLSTQRWGDFQFCEGKDNMNPKHSMATIIQTLMNNKAKKFTLNFSSQVIKIDYARDLKCTNGVFQRENGNPPVTITCSNGMKYFCNHALVTCSLGHLKNNMKMFSPPLPPPLSKAISCTSYGTIDKIFLEFETAWWNNDTVSFQFVWSKGVPDLHTLLCCSKNKDEAQDMLEEKWYYAISGFDVVFDRRPILCGWIGGPEAEYMETLPISIVTETCMALLCQFTGNSNLPDPINTFRSEWHSNPLFCGSYSSRPVILDKLECDPQILNTPIFADCENRKVPIVALAGEANSKEHYSTIHGAMENGFQQAHSILDFKNRSKILHRSKL